MNEMLSYHYISLVIIVFNKCMKFSKSSSSGNAGMLSVCVGIFAVHPTKSPIADKCTDSLIW